MNFKKKLQIFIAHRYIAILDFSIFLIGSAILTLFAASYIEFQIEKRLTDIERLSIKRDTAIEWMGTLIRQREYQLTGLIESEFLIRSLDIEMMKNSELERRNILEQSILDGSYTFMGLGEELTTIYSDHVSEATAERLRRGSRELVISVEAFISEEYELSQPLPDNWRERFDSIYNNSQGILESSSQAINEVTDNIENSIRFKQGELTQLSFVSSRIVLLSFLIQLIIYFLLQYFEISIDRRKRD